MVQLLHVYHLTDFYVLANTSSLFEHQDRFFLDLCFQLAAASQPSSVTSAALPPCVAALLFQLVLNDRCNAIECFVYTPPHVFIVKLHLTMHGFSIPHFPIDNIIVIF